MFFSTCHYLTLLFILSFSSYYNFICSSISSIIPVDFDICTEDIYGFSLFWPLHVKWLFVHSISAKYDYILNFTIVQVRSNTQTLIQKMAILTSMHYFYNFFNYHTKPILHPNKISFVSVPECPMFSFFSVYMYDNDPKAVCPDRIFIFHVHLCVDFLWTHQT